MAASKLVKKGGLQVVTLSKEQIENINNYASQITTLKDFVAAVRKRPGMYIGYRGNFGFLRCIREVLQNAIDEMMRKDSPCNAVAVTFYEKNQQIIIEDNGRGIPFNNIIRIFSKQHTSSNYEKKLFDYTSGTNGVGAKVSMALSAMFVIESYILGQARRVEFHDGEPWAEGEKEIQNPGKQGTMVSFTPSYDALGDVNIKCEDVLRLIEILSPLTNLGSKIYFKGVKLDGTSYEDVITNEDGLMGLMIMTCDKPMIDPIIFEDDNGEQRASVIIDWDSSAAQNNITETWSTYSNFCPTNYVESSHSQGLAAGIKEFFVKYMNNIYLNTGNNSGKKKAKPLKVIEEDIRSGIRVVLDYACLEPNFTGQAKDVLQVPEAKDYVKDMTVKKLEEWSKTNPQQLNKMCKYFKEIATIRSNSDEKKVSISKSYKQGITGLPSKFIAPSENWVELYIVEGDSAKGPARNNRNTKTQGILPIRGMIKNCFDLPLAECYSNEEVASILMLCGYQQGKKYNPEWCKWEKIIFAGDADSAGAQICALLLRCFLRLMPELIIAGKVYKVVPPLYYVINKGKKMFFTDKIALVKWVQSQFSKANTICTMDGKKIGPSELQEILYHNIDYIYELKKIADRYRIEMPLLEMYLMNRTKTPKDICKAIKSKYRFMNPLQMTLSDGKIIQACEGSINKVNNLVMFTDRMIEESANIIKILNGNLYEQFLINGKPGTLFDLMSVYEGYQPNSLTRIKGLGEQNGKDLGETVILPAEDGGQRTLIQYTMSEAMSEIDEIRKFETNKALLLKDLVVTRMDITD